MTLLWRWAEMKLISKAWYESWIVFQMECLITKALSEILVIFNSFPVLFLIKINKELIRRNLGPFYRNPCMSFDVLMSFILQLRLLSKSHRFTEWTLNSKTTWPTKKRCSYGISKDSAFTERADICCLCYWLQVCHPWCQTNQKLINQRPHFLSKPSKGLKKSWSSYQPWKKEDRNSTRPTNNSDKNDSDTDGISEQKLNFKVAICVINVILSFTALFRNSLIVMIMTVCMGGMFLKWRTSYWQVSDLAVGLIHRFFVAHILSVWYVFYLDR